MDEADREALTSVLQETAVCATDAIITAEGQLAEWFSKEGVQVNEVDRAPFIEAVKAHAQWRYGNVGSGNLRPTAGD